MAGITAFVGLPGSGKSYSAVELSLVPALKERRKIVTNLPLNLEQICVDFFADDFQAVSDYIQIVEAKDFIDPQFCEDIAGGSLVVIDECWRVWKSGTRVNKVDDKHLSFIKEHRHRSDDQGRSLDIILVTQNLADIATFLREMVETTVVTEKLIAVGQSTKFRRIYYQGAVKGFKATENSLLKDEFGTYKPEIYKYYKTHMNASQDGVLNVNESRAVQGSTIWSGWKFKLMISVLLLLVFFVYYGASKSVDEYKKKTESKPVASTPEPVSKPEPVKSIEPISEVVPVSFPEPLKPVLKVSERWRLVGHVYYSSKDYYLISDGSFTRRITSCKDDVEIICEFENEIVASFSGKRSNKNDSGLYTASLTNTSSDLGGKVFK